MDVPARLNREELPYIVILDDDPIPAKVIQESLGVRCYAFKSCSELIQQIGKLEPMGAFIDVYLENECGLDIIPQIRSAWPSTAIIVMTADSNDSLVGESLASGANDFIRKPINPPEIIARLKARMEDRKHNGFYSALRFGPLRLDVRQRTLSGDSCVHNIQQKVVDLLAILIMAKGVVVPRDVLKRELWGKTSISDNALDRKIFEARKALKTASSAIELQSIYRVGLVLKMSSCEEDSKELEFPI